jgi:hypothetical protein
VRTLIITFNFTTSTIGSILAILGAAISLYGAYINNIHQQHYRAMQTWAVSNVILLLWAVGFLFVWWADGLAGMALVGLYGFYAITNFYGLVK